MKQLLRLVGMPDRLIAFDELPEDLLKDLDMQNEKSMPRYWREWIGNRTRTINIKSYVDPMTRKLIECAPLVEEGPFSWVVDWEINSNKDAWSMIAAYVRQNVQEGFRLMDKLEDMAKPMAPNVSESITLEPEEIVIIPLKKVVVESNVKPSVPAPADAPKETSFKCAECGKEFQSKQGVVLHRTKKHAEKVPA